MASNTIYSTAPIGSRPPFATDDDHLYDHKSQPARRPKQPPKADPNARTSAYNVYDQYIDESQRDSTMGALGNSMLNGDFDDDDDEDPFDDSHRPAQPRQPSPQQSPVPLAAPKPGYAAPIAALNLSPPSPAASPVRRSPSPSQHPRPLMLVNNLNSPGSPRMPSPGISVPSTPHPLPPTITPITPVFVRPTKGEEARDVKFAASTPILRGEKEETLLPKRGERGDDFWRRFSIIVKQEQSTPQKTSAWLRKTQSGTTRLTRWVWVIGLILLICIAGGIGIGVYIGSQDSKHSTPTALGGSANEKLQETTSAPAVVGGGAAQSTSFHVSPTHTVARRDDARDAEPTDLPSSFSDSSLVRPVPPSRHRRHTPNRKRVET